MPTDLPLLHSCPTFPTVIAIIWAYIWQAANIYLPKLHHGTLIGPILLHRSRLHVKHSHC
ncbi:hypothetical protein PMIN01_09036 [Paraphaeosphaeria minitans]|uniref:Uncharacterized protein n=1 Tax=Paraphaeosphaeria minitans TaxID=565426 RepID=A0A9P6GDL9_9PLEO|nr:hypothetical protein PMIN01_09036 [Paraphaeosphaeria minitans]